MLEEIKNKAEKAISEAKKIADLEDVYRKFLGRQGELTQVFRSLKDLAEKEKKEMGQKANEVRKFIEEILEDQKKKLQILSSKFQDKWLDVTAPSVKVPYGHIHPISQIRKQIEDIFQSMGFLICEGFEIETEYYNFDALNVPADHSARDLWDTFWLKPIEGYKDRMLLRTHTSPMQARYMEKNNPPLRIIVPGRCFRHEATDATHDVQFYQIEGLMVDKNISVANFKGVMDQFLKRMFGPETEVRFRPSYFPFTEPSFEIDMKRKGGKWMEMMGAGMVNPKVFEYAKLNSNEWQGFAFGLGLDRFVMLKYKITDIRLLYSGDLRFLKQF